jgi:hypothetical protein
VSSIGLSTNSRILWDNEPVQSIQTRQLARDAKKTPTAKKIQPLKTSINKKNTGKTTSAPKAVLQNLEDLIKPIEIKPIAQMEDDVGLELGGTLDKS